MKNTFKTGFLSLFTCTLLLSCAGNRIFSPQSQNDIINIYHEYYNIAEVYFSLEKYDKSAEYYSKALSSKDIYWQSYNGLAKSYVYNSKWNDALPLYETLLKRDPDNSSLKASMAYIYAQSGKTSDAVKIYTQLYFEEPQNVTNLENLLSIILYEKNLEEGEKYFEILKTEFSDNKKIDQFQKEIDQLKKDAGIVDSEPKSESEPVTDSQ